jgi:hypothetical protein
MLWFDAKIGRITQDLALERVACERRRVVIQKAEHLGLGVPAEHVLRVLKDLAPEAAGADDNQLLLQSTPQLRILSRARCGSQGLRILDEAQVSHAREALEQVVAIPHVAQLQRLAHGHDAIEPAPLHAASERFQLRGLKPEIGQGLIP